MIVVLIFGRRVMVKSVCCDSNVKCLDVRERVVYPKIEVAMKMKGNEKSFLRNEADQFCRGI